MTPIALGLSVALQHWKAILAGIALLGLTIALVAARSDARHHKKRADAATLQIDRMQAQATKQEADAEKRVADAAQAYAKQAASIEPFIVKSREVVREYAKTDAGRAVCLDDGRVRGIEADDRALEAATASTSGAGAMLDPAAR